jgi:hypothetical protein
VIAYTNAYVPQMITEVHDAGATKVFDKLTMTPLMLAEAFRNSLDSAGEEPTKMAA